MDISLPHDMESILKAKVAAGIFSTMDEALTFAIQYAISDKKTFEERMMKLLMILIK